MKTLKSLLLAFAIILLTYTQSKAQENANAGIYIEGTFVDKIDCWSFKNMFFIFPISEKYKKYDNIILTITISYNNESSPSWPIKYIFQQELTQSAFSDNFEYSKYGVWKFLRSSQPADGRHAEFEERDGRLSFTYANSVYNKYEFAGFYEKKPGKYVLEKRTNYVIYFDVKGRNNSDPYERIGNGPIMYKNDTYLYRSAKIPVNNCTACTWDPNAACNLTGKKVELNIENSLAYKDHLGLIK